MEKLKNPPIKEALLHVSFALPENIDVETFRPFLKVLEGKYPTVKKKVAFNVVESLEGDESIINKNIELAGFLLINKEETQLIQITKNGLALNRLKPYTSWEELITEYHLLFDEFVKLFPRAIYDKLSVRYINKLDLVIDSNNGINDYITLYPNIPVGIPSTLNKYFLQAQVPNDDGTLVANITQNFHYCKNDSKLIHYTFDIEINTSCTIIKEEIFEHFERLRVFKNKIFFNSITEITKNIYNAD